MEKINIGNDFFARQFFIRDNTFANNASEKLTCFNYQGLTDVPADSCSLVFQGVRHTTGTERYFEGPHEVFSLNFADCRKPLKLRWRFRFFDGVAGYESVIEITSDVFPLGDWKKFDREDRLDILPVDPGTTLFHLAQFRAATDEHNEFITFSTHSLEGSRKELWLDGNLLRTEKNDHSGIIIMKVSPSHHDRRERIKATFRVDKNRIAVYGWGIEPHEFILKKKMQSYPLVVIPYRGGHFGAMEALRDFLKVRWEHSFSKSPLLMVNPWGGGGQYFRKHVNERWIEKELKSSTVLGTEVYQIDDGWESGSLANMCLGVPSSGEFWTHDRKKFPAGFSQLSHEARKKGVKLGLWFCPDFNRQYENWKKEADIIAEIHQKCGFEHFKIDGASHRSYAAEKNFDSLLKESFKKSGKRITFNLDVTAGIRMGFLYSPEFGPLFPANRYPFARNGAANKYYPCNTLKNFWKLAHIIPPHLIQVEIPDIFFNPLEFPEYGDNRYSDSDPGNPLHFGPLYCAMIGFFASPLFWLQPSRTKGKLLKEYSKMSLFFKKYRDNLHKGFVYPFGEQPDGTKFTGFMSMEGKSGLILVFRERTRQKSASILLPCVGQAKVKTVFSNTHVKASINNACLDIRLEDGPSFALLSFSDAQK